MENDKVLLEIVCEQIRATEAVLANAKSRLKRLDDRYHKLAKRLHGKQRGESYGSQVI